MALASYLIEISQNASDFSILAQSATVPSSEVQIVFSYIFTNLTKGSTYFARVLAVNSVGMGAFSPPSSGSVAVDIASSPQINSVLTGNFAGTNYMKVSWAAPWDAGMGLAGSIPILSYAVQISNTSSFTFLVVSQNVQSAALSTTLQSSNLVKGLKYFVRLFAFTVVGLSSSSEVYERLFITAPSAPSSVKLTVSGQLKLALTWQPPLDSGAGAGVAYQLGSFIVLVYLGASSSKFEVPASNFACNITSFNGLLLVKGNTYYATVSASNDADGGLSIAAQSPPVTVIDLSDKPSSTVLCSYDSWMYTIAGVCSQTGPQSISLTWAAPTDSGAGKGITTLESTVLTYEIALSSDNSFSSLFSAFQIDAVAGQSTFSYTFTGLTRNLLYWARVRAITSIGPGEYAISDGKFTVNTPGPSSVQSIQSKTDNNNYYISLAWIIPQDTGSSNASQSCLIISYSVTVSNDPSGNSVIFSEVLTMFSPPLQPKSNPVQSKSVQYTTTHSVQKGSTYFVTIKAGNAVGMGQASGTMRLLVTGYPGQPTNVLLSVAGPLMLLARWSPPVDLGAGPGVPYSEVVFEYLAWSWMSGSQAASLPALGLWQPISGGVNASSYLLLNLTKGMLYRVAIRAVNLASGDPSLQASGIGGGLWMEDSTGGVVAISVPTAPLNFTLKPFGNGSLLALWNNPLDTGAGGSVGNYLNSDGYEVQICEKIGCNVTLFLSFASTIVSYQFSQIANKSLSIGVSIEARIRAINSAGLSPWSTFSESAPLRLPGIPTNISMVLGGEQAGLVIIYVAFSAPSETGLGSQSTLALITFVQIQSVPTASSSSCFSPAPIIITPIKSVSSRVAFTGLSKVISVSPCVCLSVCMSVCLCLPTSCYLIVFLHIDEYLSLKIHQHLLLSTSRCLVLA